ncbi:N-methyl-L-tryptophan oxidase [Trichoplax sp. H2]|nr:N-methyl-L-tryptophan oxidase [Trichoplax sp. H2]|eukprot:RDD36955.1 N-methyl-L-tryptophan oxidase [Trichoplax sp. H2]
MGTDLGSFDITIIGAGCIGSACARHLSQLCEKKICLIGPDEPDHPRSQDTERSVYGAHYDAGRITRILDPDLVWAKLAQRSIPRYVEVEEKSNMQFYTPSGYLGVVEEGTSYIDKVKECAKLLQVEFELLDHQQLKSKFPYFSFPPSCVGIYQPSQGGYINIRQHVIAQMTIAQKQGCTLIKEIVDRVDRDDRGQFKIVTEKGNYLYSGKVILATGAFTPFKKLLPDPQKQLDIELMKETVVKLQVKDKDLQDMKSMPAVIYFTGKDARYDCYILPPIRYDDGKFYIKIGHGLTGSDKLDDHQQVIEWYRNVESDNLVEVLVKTINRLMPTFEYGSVVTDHCVSTHTPSNHVMIGEVNEGVTVLTGGCSHAAKSADEIGHLGALTALSNDWSYDIPKSEFSVYFKQN